MNRPYYSREICESIRASLFWPAVGCLVTSLSILIAFTPHQLYAQGRPAGVASAVDPGYRSSGNSRGGGGGGGGSVYDYKPSWAAPLDTLKQQIQENLDRELELDRVRERQRERESRREELENQRRAHAAELQRQADEAAERQRIARMTPAERREYERQLAKQRAAMYRRQREDAARDAGAEKPGYRWFGPMKLILKGTNSSKSVGYGVPVGAALNSGYNGQPSADYLEVWNYSKMPIRVLGWGGTPLYVGPNQVGKFPARGYKYVNTSIQRRAAPLEVNLDFQCWLGKTPSKISTAFAPRITTTEGGIYRHWDKFFDSREVRNPNPTHWDEYIAPGGKYPPPSL